MRRVLAVAGLVVAVAVGVWARGPVAGVDLVEVGTIGDLPPAAETIQIIVYADGSLWFDVPLRPFEEIDEKKYNFAALRKHLQTKRKPSPPFKGSPTNVLLSTDKKLPWQALQWILTACAEEKLNRIFHAVKPEGGGDKGAMALFLPIDGAMHQDQADPPLAVRAEVSIGSTGPSVEPAELYAKLKKVIAKLPAANRENIIVTVKATSAMPSGYVLRAIDMSMRAGAKQVDLYGTAIPPRDADLKKLVKELRAQRRGDRLPGITVLGTLRLEPSKDGVPKVPAVARVKGYAGITKSWSSSAEEEPEEEEEEIEEEPLEAEEEVVEEPVAPDEEPGDD